MNQPLPPNNPQPDNQTSYQNNSYIPQKNKQKLYLQLGDLFSKPIIWLIGVVLVGLVVREVFFKPAVISVTGIGRVKAEPVQVEMIVTRVDSDADPVMAVVSGEDSINRLMAKAQELAGPNVKIQKSFYQVSPSAVGNELVYQVVNVFKITANDPNTTSDLIKGLYGVGATNVSNVNFIPQNKEIVTQEARKLAIEEARQKAKNIAGASGKRVGRVLSVSEDQGEGNSTVSTNDAAAGAMGGLTGYTTGVPSEIDVAKSMTVTYNIW